MTFNDYDPVGGHTKEEADAAYAELFKEIHGRDLEEIEEEKKEKEKVAVVGHRNPDTDSICSAIAYAKLKNETDPGYIFTPYRIGQINDETAYVLKYFGIPEPELLEDIKASVEDGDHEKSQEVRDDAPRRNIILVDHNEKAQAVSGIEEAKILEIIDHHRLACIETAEPVTFRSQPFGSTSTIVYEIYKEKGVVPDRATAGLLCAAIISDTLLFKSPTTTKVDKLTGTELAAIAGLDMEAFAKDMFPAGKAAANTDSGDPVDLTLP